MENFNSNLVGKEIIYTDKKRKKYNGTILSLENGKVEISIGEETKALAFPDAFTMGLSLADTELQKQLEDYAEKTIVDRKEASRKAAEKAQEQRAAENAVKKALQKQENKTRHPVDRILRIGDYFPTHADALNDCFGYNYPNFQQGGKDIEGTKYYVWFPAPSKTNGSAIVSSIDSQWVNTFKKNEIDEYNPDYKNISNYEIDDGKLRVVFKKDINRGGYVFIGVYEPNYSDIDTTHVRKYFKFGEKLNLKTLEIIE